MKKLKIKKVVLFVGLGLGLGLASNAFALPKGCNSLNNLCKQGYDLACHGWIDRCMGGDF